jgi:hypothetical protein
MHNSTDTSATAQRAVASGSLLAAVDTLIDGRHVITLWPWSAGVMASLGYADPTGKVTPITSAGGATSEEAISRMMDQAANDFRCAMPGGWR